MNLRLALRVALLVAVATTVGCDRMTKQVAEAMLAGTSGRSFLADTVRLEFAENSGGFLSVGAGLPVAVRTGLFTVGTALMIVFVAVVAIRRRAGGWALLGMGLFVAGGASNWIDRVTRGSVVDFVSIGVGPLRTGIFNMADVAIMVGITIFLVAEFKPAGDVFAESSHPADDDPTTVL